MVKWFVLMDILDKGVSLKNAETEINTLIAKTTVSASTEAAIAKKGTLVDSVILNSVLIIVIPTVFAYLESVFATFNGKAINANNTI